MRGGGTVLGRILGNRRLRRVQLAFLAFCVAEYGVWMAVLVYAYAHGGATASGLIAVAQLGPAALVAPFAAALTDSRGGWLTLELGYAIQAVTVGGAAALMLAGGPQLDVYALAILAATAVTLSRPAQAKHLSALVELPEELTAATAVSSWMDSASALTGPLLTGILTALDGPGAAAAAFAVGLGAACVLAWAPPALRDSRGAAEAEHEGILSGLRQLRREPSSRALVTIITVEHILIGALDVIVVVLAVSAVGLGPSGAGYLNALFGAGAAAGATLAVGLSTGRTVARGLAGAVLAWAAAFALLGAYPVLVAAIVLLPTAGIGQSVLATGGRALLARVTPHEVLGRVFGVLEGCSQAGLAVGALLVPLLVSAGGVRLALIGMAVLLVSATLLPLSNLRALDKFVPPADGIERLRAHPLFAGLPPASIEGLARELEAVPARPGQTVIAEGEVGDRFYLVEAGELDVTITGDFIRTMGPGWGFGEIALLHDVPRTATVIATTDCLLYALARRPFLDALRPAI